MHNEKKQWRARVILPVSTHGPEGSLVQISPGDYTLIEGEGARYQLVRRTETSSCLSLWFAELQLCSYMGQLEILGVWP